MFAGQALDLGRGDDLRRVFESPDFAAPLAVDLGLAMLDGDFVHAADEIGSFGDRTNEVLMRLRAAERFAADGRRAEADAQLALALDFLRSVRATRYVRRAETLLAATA